ncbi:ORC ubiquitin ligase 1 [Brachionichthys hirsutus]|uniref:ORC ubiquitin ligase 1 n=1 Tax=Brachionichthys hirsutus TaxID=412623 RepID=UPI0036047F5F
MNFQTSTLSLTLPISCQICLGKVRQPVICANHHVFCSSCIEMWLKTASLCPTCRVPITAENPCREIIGGTNETDHSDGPSMRKCLRKTRGELLLREYEDEIEALIGENEDLKIRNQSLESQLKTALDPCSIKTVNTVDKKVDPYILEEWTNKLRAATDVCDKVKQDMDKLKEKNKTLRSQNVDLVQENMRLKAEVTNRSPQKFGRYTVAALEAKIQQYERDVDHLKRALERSDQYIEDLESRVGGPDNRRPEVHEGCRSSTAGSEAITQQQKINMMMRSLSDNERGSICSHPEAEYQIFSRNHSFECLPSTDQKEENKNMAEDFKGNSSEPLPTTPSSAFQSLTLRSPGIREKKVAFKPMSYLRKLNFEDFPSPSKSVMENHFSSLEKFHQDFSLSAEVEPSKSVLWGDWQRPESSEPSPSKESSAEGATCANFVSDDPESSHMSSEASMDAAYLDKISELDSMLDGESSSSRGSQLSLAASIPADLDDTLVPEQTCHDVSSSRAPCDDTDSPPNDKEPPKVSAEESFAAQGSDGDAEVDIRDRTGVGVRSQNDELSFDLLFNAPEENKAGHSGSPGHVNPSFSSSCNGRPINTTKDELNIAQPAKRKSHSPFNVSSPTKLSKLM